MQKINRRKACSLVVILNMILSMIYPIGMVFAEDSNIKLTLTTNKTTSESGEEIEFNLSYETLNGPGSIKEGDVLTFKLPDVFKDIHPKYPTEHFKSVTVNETEVSAVFSKGANDAIGGYMSIKATAQNVETNTTDRIEVNLNGTVQYIDIEIKPPVVVPPDVVDRELLKCVDNANSYDGYEDGVLINNINRPIIGKRVKYSIYINEKYTHLNDSYIYDTIPNGMELVKDSIRIYETPYGQQEKDVTADFNDKINLENNSIRIDFGNIQSKYIVRYDVIVGEEMPRYDNIVNLVKSDGELSSKAIVKPKDDARMLIKNSRTKETSKDENGNEVGIVGLVEEKVEYILDINPDFQDIKNVILEDVMPEGMELVDGSIRVGSYDISSNFEWVTDKIKDNIKFENNKLTINIGDTNKNYIVCYDLKVTEVKKAYTNKAKLNFDKTHTEVKNVVRYEMNAGAINARKGVDKKELKKGDSQIVNYTVDFSCYGFFNKGYLKLTDKLDPKVEILDVEAPEHFSVNINKDTNTIDIINDIKEIEYGEKLQVKIKTDFSKVDDGSTVANVAKINNTNTNKVETKKGYKFIAKKIDSSTNQPLEGASFELMDNNKNVIATLESDSLGVISYGINNPGDYYLKETKAPNGYNLNNKEIKFTVSENNLGTTINLGNILNTKSKCNATIKNVDFENENKVLPGAVFEIQNLDGKKITTITTNESGVANIRVLPGIYKIIEKKSAEGYILNSEPVIFEVKLNEHNYIVIKGEKIKGSIEITKVDSEDSKNGLFGGEYTLSDEDKNEVAKGITNPTNEDKNETDEDIKENLGNQVENIEGKNIESDKLESLSNPDTSDTGISMYVGLMVVSTIGLAVNCISRKKK